jgi:hypothetical protein
MKSQPHAWKSKPSSIVPHIDLPEPQDMAVDFVYNSYDPYEAVDETPSIANQSDGGSKYQQYLAKYNDGNFQVGDGANLEAGINSFIPKYNRISWSYDPKDAITDTNEHIATVGQNSDAILYQIAGDGIGLDARAFYEINSERVMREDAFSSTEYLGFRVVNSGVVGHLKHIVSSSLINVSQATDAFIEATNLKIQAIKNAIEGGTNTGDLEILYQLYGEGADEFDSTQLSETLSSIYEDTTTFLESGEKEFVIENEFLSKDQKQAIDSSVSMTCKLQLFGAMIVAASQNRKSMHSQQYQQSTTFATGGDSFATLASTISNNSPSLLDQHDENWELFPKPLLDPRTNETLSLTGYSPHAMYQVGFGFLIDKFRINPDGSRELTEGSPIFVPRNTRSFLDINIRYGQRYVYNISALYLARVPVYSFTTSKYGTQYLLIRSSNDNFVSVSCVYKLPPPPPTEIEAFLTPTVDGDELTITWHNPLTRQDHIKGFQVFRRETIDKPFELHRQINFSNSKTSFSQNESIPKELLEFPTDVSGKPMYRNFYIDNDFDINKSYIYAIASIDAHGLLSNYSEQIRYSFDARKRVLIKELVSIQNAPRQMPNYYMENQLVNLSMGDSNSRSMKVYLDPDYLRVEATSQYIDIFPPNVEYKLQLLNLDLQQVQNLNIVINNTISSEIMQNL